MAQATNFWNSGKVDPVRKYRFSFNLGSGQKGKKDTPWWWAKTVTKPSYEVNSSEYQLGNHKFKYPGILTWQDVNLTIIDTGSKASELMERVQSIGYQKPTEKSTGISKGNLKCIIQQYDRAGGIIEEWTLNNTFIKSINFGDLDYSSDDLVEIQVTLMYDWAELGGKEMSKSGGTASNTN